MYKKELKEVIEKIISAQQKKVTVLTGKLFYPVDIFLTNGNILLRSFRILELEGENITGITWHEEYAAPREGRDPVYSYFNLEEIASLSCDELEISYEQETSKS